MSEHWQPKALDARPVRLPVAEAEVLRAALEAAPAPRRRENSMPSKVGLVLALGVLAGVAWVIWPDSPVAGELIR